MHIHDLIITISTLLFLCINFNNLESVVDSRWKTKLNALQKQVYRFVYLLDTNNICSKNIQMNLWLTTKKLQNTLNKCQAVPQSRLQLYFAFKNMYPFCATWHIAFPKRIISLYISLTILNEVLKNIVTRRPVQITTITISYVFTDVYLASIVTKWCLTAAAWKVPQVIHSTDVIYFVWM